MKRSDRGSDMSRRKSGLHSILHWLWLGKQCWRVVHTFLCSLTESVTFGVDDPLGCETVALQSLPFSDTLRSPKLAAASQIPALVELHVCCLTTSSGISVCDIRPLQAETLIDPRGVGM